jgi:hypothetical protein
MLTYPKHYKLMDHNNEVAVITVHDLTEQAEVERLCRAACRECTHSDLLGACLEIVPATQEDWNNSHG